MQLSSARTYTRNKLHFLERAEWVTFLNLDAQLQLLAHPGLTTSANLVRYLGGTADLRGTILIERN